MMATEVTRRRYRPEVPGIDYGVLARLGGFAVRRAQLVITEAFDADMQAYGLTTQRFSALVLIACNPGIRQTDLAGILGIARSGVVVLVAALEEAGLVQRSSVDGDRRAAALRVTRSGESRLPEIIARVEAHDAAMFGTFSGAQVEQLADLLRRIGRSG